MRLPPIPPKDLTPEQRELCGAFHRGIAEQFQGFETARADGALLGPFNPWLHEPAVGRATWALTEAVSAMNALPEVCGSASKHAPCTSAPNWLFERKNSRFGWGHDRRRS